MRVARWCVAAALVVLFAAWWGGYELGYRKGQDLILNEWQAAALRVRGLRHEIIAIRDCRGDTCYGITKDGQTVALRPNTMVGDKPLIEWPRP